MNIFITNLFHKKIKYCLSKLKDKSKKKNSDKMIVSKILILIWIMIVHNVNIISRVMHKSPS